MTPIVFIHGFGGGSYEFQPIIRFLKKNGHKKFYEFCYEKKWGEVSLKEIAKEFAHFLDKNVKEETITIVAMSQGGIIAGYYLQHLNKKKVKKCFTICTPYKGSVTAYLSSRPGAKELRPQSAFLKKINFPTKRTKFYAVYNPLDLMVFPGTNAIFDKATKNKRVFSVGHLFTFWNKHTLQFILENL